MPIGFDDLVHDVMNDWPATIRIFLDFRMGCVGCPIACFHTVDDACGEHHVDRAAFLAALREVVESGPEQPSEKIVQGPAVVVGMCSGGGMHGARDAPRLIAELKRNDTVYAGAIGNVAGSENLVLKAVEALVRKPAWPK